ncbi:unnamed protein product [Eruca vesicaria subsp. sativa]|uniref:Uncharacterized protein n=1 Tax=Eruca vesicaria subsp. sativa TaxID=29727 RepID=A0ABC8K8G3_ERUVS|nr:unnamed protein product [Eruca vesicaria subsp. sativa]
MVFVDHALRIHLTSRGVKRKAKEEEDEKRKGREVEEERRRSVEASKEKLEKPINSHQNSNDVDCFFTGFIDSHLLDIDIESSINSFCLKKSSDKD